MATDTSWVTRARRSCIQHLCAPRRYRNRELHRVDLHGPACRVRVCCRQPVCSGCLGVLFVRHAITAVTEFEAVLLSDSGPTSYLALTANSVHTRLVPGGSPDVATRPSCVLPFSDS